MVAIEAELRDGAGNIVGKLETDNWHRYPSNFTVPRGKLFYDVGINFLDRFYTQDLQPRPETWDGSYPAGGAWGVQVMADPATEVHNNDNDESRTPYCKMTAWKMADNYPAQLS